MHKVFNSRVISMQIKPFLLPVLIVISLAQGCSFSNSSASSASISGSSEKDDEEYQLEVLNYTSAYITSTEFDRFAFARGISEIATANGITNWEDDEATLMGIGRGLKNSNISGSLYATYKKSLADSDASRMQMIQKGYDMQ